MKDIFGRALLDYSQQHQQPLLLHTSYGPVEEMPVEVFFRDEDDFSELEDIALALCDGKVLDVGAGAGAHSLYLQKQGFEVISLERSPLACKLMESRGLNEVIEEDIFGYSGQVYDTILMLMNGIGLVEKLDRLVPFLEHCKTILKPGGQLLFDSSNISYLYEDQKQQPDHYFGEVRFQYEYAGELGDPFGWVYIDQQSLIALAQQAGWVVQILYEDEYDQYLVRLSVIEPD